MGSIRHSIPYGGNQFSTLAVEKMVSRVGSSIVNAAGTPEMITKNLEEYEELAVKLAKNYLSPGAGAVSQLDKIERLEKIGSAMRCLTRRNG